MRVVLRIVLTILGPFIVGLLVWWGLYFLLLNSMGHNLTSEQEAAFKAGYVLVALIGVVLALGLGWLLAHLQRLSVLWTILGVLFLIAMVVYPAAVATSYATDCKWDSVDFPMQVECD